MRTRRMRDRHPSPHLSLMFETSIHTQPVVVAPPVSPRLPFPSLTSKHIFSLSAFLFSHPRNENNNNSNNCKKQLPFLLRKKHTYTHAYTETETTKNIPITHTDMIHERNMREGQMRKMSLCNKKKNMNSMKKNRDTHSLTNESACIR